MEEVDAQHSSAPDYRPDVERSKEDSEGVEESLWHRMTGPSYLANSILEEAEEAVS